MNTPYRSFTVVDTDFHPVSHYDTPADILCDGKLSTAEKRVILSSWASDMYAVESHPALREVPGVAHVMRLSDILAALRELDGQFDPPRGGGAAMRTWRPVSLAVIGRKVAAAGDRRPPRRSTVARRGGQQSLGLHSPRLRCK
jgi:hypothetical protein